VVPAEYSATSAICYSAHLFLACVLTDPCWFFVPHLCRHASVLLWQLASPGIPVDPCQLGPKRFCGSILIAALNLSRLRGSFLLVLELLLRLPIFLPLEPGCSTSFPFAKVFKKIPSISFVFLCFSSFVVLLFVVSRVKIRPRKRSPLCALLLPPVACRLPQHRTAVSDGRLDDSAPISAAVSATRPPSPKAPDQPRQRVSFPRNLHLLFTQRPMLPTF
jgi:hypothetical protein